MYIPSSKQIIPNGIILHWKMQGRPGRNANLGLTLQIRFVITANDKRGIVLGEKSQIPDAIEVTAYQPFDTINWKGKVLWLQDLNGLVVTFEGDDYQLFTISDVKKLEGTLYFHTYPPEECGSGELVYDDRQFLESAAAINHNGL